MPLAIRHSLVSVLGVWLASCVRLVAADFTWSSSASATFNATSNWAGGVVPSSATDTTLIFPSLLTQLNGTYTATNDLGTFDLNSLRSTVSGAGNLSTTVSAGSTPTATLRFNVNGATLPTIVNDGTGSFLVQNGSATTGVTINGGTTLRLLTSSVGNLTVSAAIGQTGGIGSVELAGTGPRAFGTGGLIALTGANAYAGGTTITSGNIGVGNGSAFGTGIVTVSGANHTLQATTATSLANAFQLNQTLNVTGTSDFRFNGSFSGPGGVNFTPVGNQSFAFFGNNSFTGAVTLQAIGNVVPSTGPASGVGLSSGATLTGASGYMVADNSYFSLAAATAVGNRLNPAAGLTLHRAGFSIDGSDTVPTVENLASLTTTGMATIFMTLTSAQPVTVAFGTWNHAGNSTVVLAVPGLGGTGGGAGNVAVANDPGGAVGGGGGPGTTTRSILPYVSARVTASDGTPTFVAWDAATGKLVPLNPTTDYASNLYLIGTSNPTANVRRAVSATNSYAGGTASLNAATTVNSLLLGTDRNDAIVFGNSVAGSATLTVAGGAVYSAPRAAGGFGSNSQVGSVLNLGGLDFGSRTGYLHVNEPLYINAPISGSGGIVKSDVGTLFLSGPSNFTGNVQHNGGFFAFNSDAALGAAANAIVHNGGLTAQFAYRASPYFDRSVGGLSPVIARPIVLGPAANNNFANLLFNSVLTYSGTVSGPGGFRKSGEGAIVLTGTNTFAGPLTASEGILAVSGDAAMGSATASLILVGGTFQPQASFATARNVLVTGTNSTVFAAGSTVLRLDGQLASFANNLVFAKAGGGELNLTAANTYSGRVAVGDAAGVVRLTVPAAAETGGTLRLSGANGAIAVAGGQSTAPTFGFTVNPGAALVLDNTVAVNGDRIGSVPVALNGGTLRLVGNAAADTTEFFGTSPTSGLNVTALGGTIVLDQPASGGRATTFVATSFNPVGAAMAVFQGTNLGAAAGDRTAVLFNANPAQTNGLIPAAVFASSPNDAATDFATTVASGTQFALARFTTYAGALPTTGGSAAATYDQAAVATLTGPVSANAVRFSSGGGIALGANTLTLTTGSLLFVTGAGNVTGGTIAAGVNPFRLTNAGNVSVGTAAAPTALTGTGGFTKAGAGTLTLFGTAATTMGTSGGVFVAQGTLALGNATALGTGTVGGVSGVLPQITVGAGATLDVSALAGPVRINSINGFGGLALGNATIQTGADNSTVAGGVTGSAGSRIAVGVPQSEATGNTFGNGNVAVTLAGNNSGFAGSFAVYSGILSIESATGLGTGASVIQLGDVTGTNQALIRFGPAVPSFGRDIVVGASTPSSPHAIIAPGAANFLISSNIALNSPLVLSGPSSFFTGTGTMTLTGVLSGPGSVRQIGNVALTGANTFTGGYTADAGTTGVLAVLGLGSDSTTTTGPLGTGTLTFGTNGALLRADGGPRTINNPIAIALSPRSDNFGVVGVNDLTLRGTVDMGTQAALNFNIANKGVTTFAGVISNGGIFKNGPGSVVFSAPAGNSYAGGTVVNAGVLLVANVTGSGTGSGAVTVNDGAILGGTGIIAGAITLNAGSILAPGGIDNVGTLTTNVQPTFAGGLLQVKLAALGLGNYGRLNVTASGSLNLGAGNPMQLVVTPYAGATDGSFTIIGGTGATVLNRFGNLPIDQSFVFTNPTTLTSYGIYYGTFAGSPGSVVIAPIPVPEPALVLTACAAAVGLWRRRRP